MFVARTRSAGTDGRCGAGGEAQRSTATVGALAIAVFLRSAASMPPKKEPTPLNYPLVAVLSAAQAHLRLASLCDGDDGDPASEHRRKAKALLQSLTAPPYEPPETRWHRVRAYEKREIKTALGAL